MAIPVSLNGAPYSIPEVGDPNWAAPLSLYLQALATAFPQITSGSNGFGCYAEAFSTAGQACGNGAFTTIIYGTEVTDTDNAYNPATGQFTVPVGKSGRYLVQATIRIASATADTGGYFLAVFKNNVEYCDPAGTTAKNGTNFVMEAVYVMNLVAGDVIDIRLFQSSGGTRNLDTAATTTRLTVTRML